MAFYNYVPLLENRAGYLYVSNNTTTSLTVPTSPDGPWWDSGAVSITKFPGISLTYSESNGVRFYYTGWKWDSLVADYIPMRITLRDVASLVVSAGVDLYNETPGPNPGDLDVYSQRSGGSDVPFYIWTLGWPEVASISPTSIPADGVAHNVTVTLSRRLHSSQSPNVVFSQLGGTGNISFGSVVPVRNSSNQIIGYTTTATSPVGQETATLNVAMLASETLTYLKDDLIVTENVVYNDGTSSIASMTVTKVDVTQVLPTFSGNVLRGGISEEDTYSGIMRYGTFPDGTQGWFTNGLTADMTVYTTLSTLGKLEIVVKKAGLSRPTVIATVSAGTSLSDTTVKGTTVHQKSYKTNFDTNQLNSNNLWDIGYVLYDTSNTVMLSGWYGTFYNGNLTSNVDAYSVYVVLPGTGVVTKRMYKWTQANGWVDGYGVAATPKFNGVFTVYLSENWNLSNYNNGAGELPGGGIAWDYLTWTIGTSHGTITNGAFTRTNLGGDAACMGIDFDTTNTSVFNTGNGTYSLILTLTSSERTANKLPNIEFGVPVMVDNTVVITTPADFSIAPSRTTINYDITFVNDYYATGQFIYTGPEWVYLLVTSSTVGGFAGTVTFGVDGLPAGANAIFTQPTGTFLSTSSTGPSTQLRINALSCALGTYPLTITATANGITKTANATLVVGFASAYSPVINYFTPTPNPIAAGGGVDLYVDYTPADAYAEVADGLGNTWPVTTGQTLTLTDLTQTTTYTLTVSNPIGSTNKQATVTVYGMPQIISFNITPSIGGASGTTFWLSAEYANGTGSVDQGIGFIKADGTGKSTGPLYANKTFTLTVSNSYGSVTKQVTASVGNTPIIDSFTADSEFISSGTSTTLIPVFYNADYAWVDNAIGAVTSGQGFSTGALTSTTTFTLHAINSYGETVQSVTVNLASTPGGVPPVISSFTSRDQSVTAGGTTVLYPVFSGDSVTASIDQGIGTVTSGGSYTTAPIMASTMFTLTTKNNYGVITQQVLVTVPTGGGGGGGGWGCVPAGTLVATESGFESIEALQIGQKALGYDENSMQPVVSEITNVFKYLNQQLYEIDTNEGTLICSEDHRLAVLNYGDGTYSYPSARKLAKNDVVLALRPDNSLTPATVLSVTPLDQFEDVYHLTLAEGHVFVAGGFAAHNKIKTQSVDAT